MAWMPGATRLVIPENESSPKITPTQLIFHSAAAPWSGQRMYEHWNTVNLESHLYVEYDGSVFQYLDSTRHADAQAKGNAFAISVESASNVQADDFWTDEQAEGLIRIGVWACQTHDIPAAECRAWDRPGIGYHRMFDEWNPHHHSCPGSLRAGQFTREILPEIRYRLKKPVVPAPTHPPFAGRTIGLGTKGTDVRLWQAQMRKRGWNITVDGIFGPKSQEVAFAFQHEKHLLSDGLIGRKTWNATWEAPVTR